MINLPSYKVEYLLTSNVTDCICSSIEGFHNLLKTIEGLSISGNRLTYNATQFNIDVQIGKLHNGEKIYFDVTLTSTDDNGIDCFIDLNRKVKTVSTKVTSSPVQTLWDDISHYYASMSYPLINNIENLMRKLITKFMIVNIGLGWQEKAVPKEVEQSNRIQQKSSDYLQDIDFIQLSNFLFKEYSGTNGKTIIDNIKSASKIDDLLLGDLKALVPKSNWDRHFSPIIACEADYLRIRWEKLYDLRCKVAHNKNFNKSDYEILLKLLGEVSPYIVAALDKLSEIEISEDDREEITEVAVATGEDNSAIFLAEWSELLNTVRDSLRETSDVGEHINLHNQRNNIRYLMNQARDKGLITATMRGEIKDMIYIRNAILHSAGITIQEDQLANMIEKMRKSIQQIQKVSLTLMLQGYTLERNQFGATTIENSDEFSNPPV
jgi:Apea-like HEPN